jgi:hypothetical protein
MYIGNYVKKAQAAKAAKDAFALQLVDQIHAAILLLLLLYIIKEMSIGIKKINRHLI